MAESVTPTIRCPREECNHPIDNHVGSIADLIPTIPKTCTGCDCRLTPNTIAVAAVHSALYGELTPAPSPAPVRISRQPDGSWS